MGGSHNMSSCTRWLSRCAMQYASSDLISCFIGASKLENCTSKGECTAPEGVINVARAASTFAMPIMVGRSSCLIQIPFKGQEPDIQKMQLSVEVLKEVQTTRLTSWQIISGVMLPVSTVPSTCPDSDPFLALSCACFAPSVAARLISST